jgi:hypothetical protein
MEQVLAAVPRCRILLSLINMSGQIGHFLEFRAWLTKRFGIVLPLSIASMSEPCFAYFEADGTPRVQRICYSSPLLWSLTGNAVDADETFHTFIQGIGGGQRELPRIPRNREIQNAVSVLVPAALVVGAIYFGFLHL